ncbi:MAG: tRNA (adenosine(37)-N6)-dimethylallyltransferase MiaA [Candidatus Sericytochromatia bacterium]|nr:tRNA (adenosine(37)-N6)-dimethylallyltransferase MiaA [Candidatus Sericytochromatia bacterium]
MPNMTAYKRPNEIFPEPPVSWVQGNPAGPPLVVIVGPTGSGKSSLALELAAKSRGAIISADSRQIYRGFDIGTATPTSAEQSRVAHDLISVTEPNRVYTVSDFQTDALQALERRRKEGYLPFLVGGTGLYVKALLDGLTIPPQAPDPALRQTLAALPDPHASLAQVDPETAHRLHPNDRFRIIRALEVFHLTGIPISAQQKSRPCPYRLLMIGLAANRQDLYARIDARVSQMLQNGFVDEVQSLADRWGWDLPLLRTLGYAEIGAYLRGELSCDEASSLMAQHTRNYAKRQLTWFRADPRIRWLIRETGASDADVYEKAASWLRAWAQA